MRSKKKGFTLIEIIVTLAIVGVIVTVAFSIVGYGRRAVKTSMDEYDFQSSARIIIDNANNIIRYATAVFTMPETSFRETNLTQGWSYIGVIDVPVGDGTGSEIVNYVYDSTSNTHIKTVIHAAIEDVYYNLVFHKDDYSTNDNILNFTINCTNRGGKETTITTQLEDLNALQVINYGTDVNPATAIAYRNDEKTMGAVANVAMVLDTSGSMAYDMDGNQGGSGSYHPIPVDKQRITILRSEATTLVEGFAQNKDIDVCLVPFSNTANNIKSFVNAKTSLQTLKQDISSLRANGGTNTADGLRRAYYALSSHNAARVGITPVNYVILLVDGETTYASIDNNFTMPSKSRNQSETNYYNNLVSSIQYELDDGNIRYDSSWWDSTGGRGNIIGLGNKMHAITNGYVDKVGDKWYKNKNFAKVYLIAFTNKSTDDFNTGISKLKTACGIQDKYTFKAQSADGLNKVFEEIRQDILYDLWFLNGPTL